MSKRAIIKNKKKNIFKGVYDLPVDSYMIVRRDGFQYITVDTLFCIETAGKAIIHTKKCETWGLRKIPSLAPYIMEYSMSRGHMSSWNACWGIIECHEML